MSANFSFSNAFEADKHLHGPNFYLDNNIAQLLCANRFARNLLRFAGHVRRLESFDPFGEYVDVFMLPGQTIKAPVIEMTLFRIAFSFRELDPTPLAYLQTVDRISDYLEGKKKTQAKALWLRIFEEIQTGPNLDDKSSSSGLGIVNFDIATNITLFSRTIEEGHFESTEQLRQRLLTRTKGAT